MQVKYILGIRATKSSRLQDMLLSMGQHIKQVRWQECVMGASWLALLFSVRAVSKHSQRGWVAALGPILTAGFSMAAVLLLGLPQSDTVGHIRHGLPGFTVQWWWPIPAGGCCQGSPPTPRSACLPATRATAGMGSWPQHALVAAHHGSWAVPTTPAPHVILPDRVTSARGGQGL